MKRLVALYIIYHELMIKKSIYDLRVFFSSNKRDLELPFIEIMLRLIHKMLFYSERFRKLLNSDPFY